MISPSLVASVATFDASVSAASPISQATSLTKAALVKAGQLLLGQVETEASTTGTALDASDPSGFAGDMVGQLLALSTANDDTASLVEVRGYLGRAVFNLGQA